MDHNAKTYVDTVTAHVPAHKERSLDVWWKNGKDQGWYSNIGFIGFPVWQNSTDNALIANTLESGTFNGTVTHTNGPYMQGNGTNGYLDIGKTPGDAGVTTSDVSWFFDIASGVGSSASNAGSDNGCSNSTSQEFFCALDFDSGGTEYLIFDHCDNGTGRLLQASHGHNDGMIFGNYLGGGRQAHQTSDGTTVNTIATDTDGTSGTVPTINVCWMCYNNNGTPADFDDAGYRMWGFGTSFTAAERNDFLRETMTMLDTIDNTH